MLPSSHKAYQKGAISNLDPYETLAQLFEKASSHMEEACHSIENNNIEARFKATDQAAFILANLERSLLDAPEQESVVKNLREFYENMIILIYRINMKNDLQSARSISENLLKMASAWRLMGRSQAREIPTPAPSNDSLCVQA